MNYVAEDPHRTLSRVATHATKRSVKILTVEATTNSTASPSLPTMVMTADERSRHKAARRFALGNVTNSATLPTLPWAATVQPKNMNAPLNTRTTLTATSAAVNVAAAATAALVATSTVADDDRDPFMGMTSKKISNYLRN